MQTKTIKKIVKKKCICGTKFYPHGQFLDKDNNLIQGYICPVCKATDSAPTNYRVEYKEPLENPICPKCQAKMQKWGKRYKEKSKSVMRSYRCGICGSFTSVEVPCELIKKEK